MRTPRGQTITLQKRGAVAPLEGPVIPRSRRNLFKDQSFVDCYNAGTKSDRSHAGGALHAKEEEGWGGGAHREVK